MSDLIGLQLVTLVVPDYDDAIAFFTQTLGFELVEDTPVPEQGKRWVVVSPSSAPGKATGANVLLAQASSDSQRAAIGNQTGGRVGFFLHVSDLLATHKRLTEQGVAFERPPAEHPYGKVAVMVDPWGNLWDLIEPA